MSKVQGFLVSPLLLTFHACSIFQENGSLSTSYVQVLFGSTWRKLIAKDDYYVGHKGCVKTHLIKERVLAFFSKRNLKGTFMVLPLLYHRTFWMDSALSKNLFLVLYCRIHSKKGTGCVWLYQPQKYFLSLWDTYNILLAKWFFPWHLPVGCLRLLQYAC